jgi:type VI protein secretion system component VasF
MRLRAVSKLQLRRRLLAIGFEGETVKHGEAEKRKNLRITLHALRITNHDSRITEVFLPCAEFVGL